MTNEHKIDDHWLWVAISSAVSWNCARAYQ